MKGLEDFSVRGLRRFQTILLATGLLLFPIAVALDSTWLYWFSTITFVTLFWGFREAEQLVDRKMKWKQAKKAEALRGLEEECADLFAEMKELFQQKGYSIRSEENASLNNMSFYFEKCTSIPDYTVLKKVLKNRIEFVSGLQGNRDKQFEGKKKASPAPTQPSSVSRYFKTLGIPDGTTDMIAIRKAYKQLIKENHPDINNDISAVNKTVELNLAYKKIKEHIDVS